MVVDLVVVAVLRDSGGGFGGAEHEAVIDGAGVGASVGDGGGVVLLVAGACSDVDADVAAGARSGVAHLGFVDGAVVDDFVIVVALLVVRIGSGVDIERFWRRGVIAMMMTMATPFVLISLYSNSHDRSNCENQRLECHRGFHGDSPYFILG
ncbi:hypothetical protein D3C78_802490 [compost metagenome]